jgi:hypothetical protein
MVVNTAADASDSMFFAHSAVNLTHENVFIFNGLEGFWFPTTHDGIAPGNLYLVPTSVNGTSAVKWIVDSTTANFMDYRLVQLASYGGS